MEHLVTYAYVSVFQNKPSHGPQSRLGHVFILRYYNIYLVHQTSTADLAPAPEGAKRAQDIADDDDAVAWGDNSVSSCRSYSRAKGPSAGAGAFPTCMALSLYGEDPRVPRRGAKGLVEPLGPLELAAMARRRRYLPS